MRRWAPAASVALVAAALAACGTSRPDPLDNPIPTVCEEQVYADPVVKDLIMKGAGTDNFRLNHVNQLKAAKQDASMRCQRQKGILPPGGGVERPRVVG